MHTRPFNLQTQVSKIRNNNKSKQTIMDKREEELREVRDLLLISECNNLHLEEKLYEVLKEADKPVTILFGSNQRLEYVRQNIHPNEKMRFICSNKRQCLVGTDTPSLIDERLLATTLGGSLQLIEELKNDKAKATSHIKTLKNQVYLYKQEKEYLADQVNQLRDRLADIKEHVKNV